MTAAEAARWLLEVFGSSTNLSWRLRELPKSRSIGLVSVWRPRALQHFEFWMGSEAPTWRLRELQKARSIGPVGVWRPRPLPNSSSGGVRAAVLQTFIMFEASQMVTTPISPPATHPRPT